MLTSFNRLLRKEKGINNNNDINKKKIACDIINIFKKKWDLKKCPSHYLKNGIEKVTIYQFYEKQAVNYKIANTNVPLRFFMPSPVHYYHKTIYFHCYILHTLKDIFYFCSLLRKVKLTYTSLSRILRYHFFFVLFL